MKLTIRRKLFILVGIIIITYGLAVGFIVINFREKMTEDARAITISNIRESASSARSLMNGDFEIARTVASTLANTIDFETSAREELTKRILEGTAAQDKRYLSAWLSLELSAVDENWTKPYGRKRYTYYQAGAPVFDTINTTGDVPNSLYYNLKQSKSEELLEPYLLSSTSSVRDERNNYLGTSVCVPLLKNDRFVGLAGMDITLDALDFIANIKPFKGASCFLVSNEGIIVSHEKKDLIGKTFSAIVLEDTLSVLKNIKSGNDLSFISNHEGEEALMAFTPLSIGSSNKPWSIGTRVPMSAITESINSVVLKTIVISMVGLALLIVSVYFVSKGITQPVKTVNERLKNLARGLIRKERMPTNGSTDEIGEMMKSVNTLEDTLFDKINFAVSIGAGNFETDFKTAGDEDTLGIALQTMRDNLKQFRDGEEKRTWANEGLAKLNDVLRKNTVNEDEYYHQVLKALLQFLNANQGAIFLVEDDDRTKEKYIELVAAFAYDRKKYISNRLSWGESLIGQSILEQELVHLKEIPPAYIKITSGLGEATPRVLVIVPLKTDTEVVGAIEIASFLPLQPHELQFIEKSSEIIASSIFTFRNTARAKELVD